MIQTFKRIACYLAISLASLFLLRVLLYTSYYHDFDSLTFLETINSFLMGSRVDFISVSTLMGLLVILLFLPLNFINSKIYQNIVGYAWYSLLLIMVFIVAADIVYYEFVHRHIGSEITAIGNDTHVILDMLWEYVHIFFAFLLYGVALFFLFKKILTLPLEQSTISFGKKIVIFLAVIIAVAFSIRGKVINKPFSVSDAFTTDKVASGNLALNGFYTLYRTISKKQKNYIFYPAEAALATSKTLLTSQKFSFSDKEYPLTRVHQPTQDTKTKHNVVIVLLESWSAKYVDSFGGNNLGVTPHFDEMAKNGVVFENFYSNGQRSIDAITALFTGIAPLKGLGYIGSGLELSNLSYLGSIAKKNGYSTIAMQTSKKSSFHMDAITALGGFDSYYSAEDMPLSGDEDRDKMPRFGTWDGNMYKLLSQKLSHAKEPFLSFSFTSTTHAPFISPGKKWEKYPHDTKNIFGFLNTLKYADEKLGLFMQRCAKEPWFDNTIFIFMADHTIGFGDDSELFSGTNISIKNRELENMRIPLLIYAPKIFKPQKVQRVGSQASIIPTLVDILKLNGEFSTISNSLFDEKAEQFALFTQGETIGFVNQTGFVNHNLERKLDGNSSDPLLEKKLLSIFQTTTKALQENRLIRLK